MTDTLYVEMSTADLLQFRMDERWLGRLFALLLQSGWSELRCSPDTELQLGSFAAPNRKQLSDMLLEYNVGFTVRNMALPADAWRSGTPKRGR